MFNWHILGTNGSITRVIKILTIKLVRVKVSERSARCIRTIVCMAELIRLFKTDFQAITVRDGVAGGLGVRSFGSYLVWPAFYTGNVGIFFYLR